MTAAVERMQRHQVALYLLALAVGAVVGLSAPALAAPAEHAITPVLGLLLYTTFLGVPFARIAGALRDLRFLSALVVVDFVLVPAVVWVLTRLIAHDEVLLLGAALVLLTPCVDYVIVFTAIAGGSAERLLAAAPVLMLAQMLLLPLYLWMLLGGDVARAVDAGPFLEALVLLIVVPLLAAALTQCAARWAWGAQLRGGVLAAMVPLMMLTLAVVVISQISAVGAQLRSLLLVVPVYVLFAAAMVALGAFLTRGARLDAPGRRAVVLSGTTRNSLVVLPLALALPAAYTLVPLVVVTQTLVELLVLVLLVRLLPRIIPSDAPTRPAESQGTAAGRGPGTASGA